MGKQDFIEKILGGLFAVIAVAASIAELIINGVSASTIASCVKDVFGTLVVIVLFLAVIRDSMPKIYTDFKKAFEDEMEELIKKYDPLLTKDDKEFRYNINLNLLSICGGELADTCTFFDYKEDSLDFSVKKELFMGRGKESFDEMQKKIISQMQLSLKNKFDFIEKIVPKKDGFIAIIKRNNKIKDQVQAMKQIVDYVTILYIAENKKS